MSEDTFTPLETEADAVANITRLSTNAKDLNPAVPQALIVPAGAELVVPDMSAWRDAPVRKTGVYCPATVGALIAYVGKHATDATTVWVHPTSGLVTAILDDNGDTPGYRDHRAVLILAKTPEWIYWAAKDSAMSGQEEFAEHIEGGLEEIQVPDAATMLEIAQSFHATSSAAFRSSKRLTSGEQQFQYDEEITAAAGAKGDLTIPTTILLAVAPFIAEQPYKLTARLRFRLSAGRLTLGYVLDRPDSVIRDALEGVAERIAEKFPNTYVGDAPVA